MWGQYTSNGEIDGLSNPVRVLPPPPLKNRYGVTICGLEWSSKCTKKIESLRCRSHDKAPNYYPIKIPISDATNYREEEDNFIADPIALANFFQTHEDP